MFNDYYGLSFNPFDKQCLNEKDHFESTDFKEMTARPGMGKSYTLRCFAKSLNPNLYHMAYICLSTVSVSEFYRQFCSVLGVTPLVVVMFQAIQEQVYYLCKEKKQPLLLVIDEAQYLSTGILNDIKMLMNYGYDSINCFSLLLCGESHLNNILQKPVHEALRQRITVHYNYSGLSDEEVASYILHKISCASGARSIIDESALGAIHGYCQGNPRIIDNLMTDAIILETQMDKKSIDSEVILAAVNNQQLI